MARTAFPALTLLAMVAVLSFGQSHHAGELSLEPYTFHTYDGGSHPAELGHLWVPENRAHPDDRLIQLAFVRLRTAAPNPRSPVVFLPGGPGIPATGMGAVPVYYELFAKLQAFSDVILLDQRGIGMSVPNTECPAGPAPPPSALVTSSGFQQALLARAESCARYWRAKNVDLAAFSTRESADDLDDLRRALGVDKLSLIAHSYGTAVALEAIRQHSDHLGSVVLAGTEGPGDALHMPLVTDFALRRLSILAASSMPKEFPDTYDTFRTDLGQLQRGPLIVRVPVGDSGRQAEVRAGPFLLQFEVAEMLANGRRAGGIPALIDSISRRDPTLVTDAAQDLYSALNSGFSAMQFGIYCSDGWSGPRREMAQLQASRSALGDASYVYLDPRICREIGVSSTSNESLFPIWSTVPTLLISGTLDSNEPWFQSAKILWGLPNGFSLLVENGFHETLPAPEVQSIAADFLDGKPVPSQTIHFDPPRFLTVEQARAARHAAR